MGLNRLAGLGLVLVAVAFSALGCCDPEKKQIAALQAQYNDLSSQNTDLRDQVAQARQRQSDLLSQLDAKDSELARLQAELASAKATPPPKPAAAAGWVSTPFGDKITVGSDILFASGKATLTAEGNSALAKIANDLKTTYAGLPVRVYGFTDNDPILKTKNLWTDNLDLSANRAMAVTRYLWSKGINAEVIETIAMGSTHFVAGNSDKAGKAKNRRVEIFVVKK